jgi:Xaa-Pro aminopeptidase
MSADRAAEISAKLARLRQVMADQQIDVAHLQTIANIAWITAGGALYINEGTDIAASSIVVTADRAIVLTDTIEDPRLRAEEQLEDLGFEFIAEPWFARGGWLQGFSTGQRVGSDSGPSDVDLEPIVCDLRTHLQAEEVARLREVAALASHAVDVAIRAVRPGMTEYEAAGHIAAASRAAGGTAIVNLVASDERIAQFRHPLPTSKPIERYVMLVLCMRRQGLIAAVTRLVHFGALPTELREKALAVAQVDARMILGTQAGKSMGDMFALARQSYSDIGFPDAIEHHHQGGSIAYKPREILAQPGDPTPIDINQAFAWNPSVRGVKSEDTIVLGPDGPEVITTTPGWPTWDITIGDQTISRPAILEV